MIIRSENKLTNLFFTSHILLVAIVLISFGAGGAFGQERQSKINELRDSKLAQNPLPNLVLDKIGGEKWSLEENRGSIVLLNFWATWCAPCREEIPILTSLAKTYKIGGLKVVGVSVDSENVEQINRFIKDFKINYQIVLAVPGSLLSQQESIPMSLLIDEKGVLAKKYVGAVEKDVLEKDIKDLLKRFKPNKKARAKSKKK